MDRRSQPIETLTVSPPDVLTATHERMLRGPVSRPVVDDDPAGASRRELAMWLVAGRVARGMSREQIAQVTRIQLRTIERLEDARFDELPADVFVRGFIRNYARCVGLSVEEALRKYSACGFAAAPVTAPIVQALALLDSMAPLAGQATSVNVVPSRSPQVLRDEPARDVAPSDDTAIPRVVAAEVSGASGAASLKADVPGAPGRRTRSKRVRDAKGRFVRSDAVATEQAAGVFEDLAPEITMGSDDRGGDESARWELCAVASVGEASEATPASTNAVGLAADPHPASELPESAAKSRSTSTFVVPPSATIPVVLFVDDDDPEQAERDRELRAKEHEGGGWRSFLPPVLLDQGRHRQGGLTLAVIVLLIVATLTLSYLMRRPSSTGEGITSLPASTLVA